MLSNNVMELLFLTTLNYHKYYFYVLVYSEYGCF